MAGLLGSRADQGRCWDWGLWDGAEGKARCGDAASKALILGDGVLRGVASPPKIHVHRDLGMWPYLDTGLCMLR